MKPLLLIRNKRNEQVLAAQAATADSFFARMRGLLGKSELAQGEALIIRRCNFVHMFGMKFALDIVFCTAENIVVEIQEKLAPWLVSKYVWRASFVIELPAGAAAASGIQRGDELIFEKAN